MSDLLLAYSNPLPKNVFSKLLNSILNGAKSSNTLVRTQSSRLFSFLIDRPNNDNQNTSLAVTELLALPKASKTTGAEHRNALYDMLQAVEPTAEVAITITDALPSLLAKETNDTAIALLARTLASHITFRLRNNQTIELAVINTIAREMSSSKPVIRRAFCTITGNALWDLGEDHTEAARAFATALYHAFETSLKTVSANPLSSAAGPLEGYVALAVMLGPVSRLGVGDYGNETTFTLYMFLTMFHFQTS